jgi:hypothetical protein
LASSAESPKHAPVIVNAFQIWVFLVHMHLQRTFVLCLNLAQRALVYAAHVNVHLLNMTPYAELAQDLAAVDLAAGFADESSSSWHHIFINERLH